MVFDDKSVGAFIWSSYRHTAEGKPKLLEYVKMLFIAGNTTVQIWEAVEKKYKLPVYKYGEHPEEKRPKLKLAS